MNVVIGEENLALYPAGNDCRREKGSYWKNNRKIRTLPLTDLNAVGGAKSQGILNAEL